MYKCRKCNKSVYELVEKVKSDNRLPYHEEEDEEVEEFDRVKYSSDFK